MGHSKIFSHIIAILVIDCPLQWTSILHLHTFSFKTLIPTHLSQLIYHIKYENLGVNSCWQVVWTSFTKLSSLSLFPLPIYFSLLHFTLMPSLPLSPSLILISNFIKNLVHILTPSWINLFSKKSDNSQEAHEKWYASLIIRKMQIKTTMRHHLTLIIITIIKKTTNQC